MSRRLAISSLLNESEHQSARFSTANEVVVSNPGIAADGLHALARAASMSPTDRLLEPRQDIRPRKRRHSGTDNEDDVSIIQCTSTRPISMDNLTHHDSPSSRSATSSESPIFPRPIQQRILSPSQMIQPHATSRREFVSPTLSAREYGKRTQSRRDPSEERPLPREHQFVLPGADRDHAVIGPGRISPTTTFRMSSEPSRETLSEDLMKEREIGYRSPESSHSRESVHSLLAEPSNNANPTRQPTRKSPKSIQPFSAPPLIGPGAPNQPTTFVVSGPAPLGHDAQPREPAITFNREQPAWPPGYGHLRDPSAFSPSPTGQSSAFRPPPPIPEFSTRERSDSAPHRNGLSPHHQQAPLVLQYSQAKSHQNPYPHLPTPIEAHSRSIDSLLQLPSRNATGLQRGPRLQVRQIVSQEEEEEEEEEDDDDEEEQESGITQVPLPLPRPGVTPFLRPTSFQASTSAQRFPPLPPPFPSSDIIDRKRKHSSGQEELQVSPPRHLTKVPLSESLPSTVDHSQPSVTQLFPLPRPAATKRLPPGSQQGRAHAYAHRNDDPVEALDKERSHSHATRAPTLSPKRENVQQHSPTAPPLPPPKAKGAKKSSAKSKAAALLPPVQATSADMDIDAALEDTLIGGSANPANMDVDDELLDLISPGHDSAPSSVPPTPVPPATQTIAIPSYVSPPLPTAPAPTPSSSSSILPNGMVLAPPMRKAAMKKNIDRDRDSMPPPPVKKRPPPPAPKAAITPKPLPPLKQATTKGKKPAEKKAPVDKKGKGKAADRSRSTSVAPDGSATPEVDKVEDDRLYCLCRARYNQDDTMIGCDRCDEWYHPGCVDMADTPLDLVDQFICPTCIAKNPELNLKTTFKRRCLNGLEDPDTENACMRPSLGPMSKYCSPDCGVKNMRRRIQRFEAKGGNVGIIRDQVQNARRRDGYVVPLVEGLVLKSKPQRQREMEKLHAHLATVSAQRDTVKHSINQLLMRERLLEMALDRADSKRDQCGWDQRLCFGEDEWDTYGEELLENYIETGDEWFCDQGNGCRRHEGWQELRQEDIAFEKDQQQEAIAKLTIREREIRTRIEDLTEAEAKAQAEAQAKLQPPPKPNGKAAANVAKKNGKGKTTKR